VYVSVDGVYAGCVVLADQLKPDAAQAMEDLERYGVRRTVMLTGDGEATARAVAAQLPLSVWHAGLLPDQKVAHVKRLLAETDGRGTLIYVGDGINDAPVLALSDVGVAMGAMGSDAAMEAADVVLMDDQLSKLAEAVGRSRRTLRIVRQNIVLALTVKIAVMVLGVLGCANLWMAVFADVGVAVLAILNAMRTLK
jgi:Cd2+/Zn2+-exporting ATPase